MSLLQSFCFECRFTVFSTISYKGLHFLISGVRKNYNKFIRFLQSICLNKFEGKRLLHFIYMTLFSTAQTLVLGRKVSDNKIGIISIYGSRYKSLIYYYRQWFGTTRESIDTITTCSSRSRISSGGSWPRLELPCGIPTWDTSSSRGDIFSMSAWHANPMGFRVIRGAPTNTARAEKLLSISALRRIIQNVTKILG